MQITDMEYNRLPIQHNQNQQNETMQTREI